MMCLFFSCVGVCVECEEVAGCEQKYLLFSISMCSNRESNGGK